MKNKIQQIFLVFATVIVIPCTAQTDQSTLTINQPAPPIKVEAWLKGKPVEEFKKGMIYVLDFGFISCGPCRAAIPQLTELARKYEGQIEIISVHVYENSKSTPGKAYVQKVRNFIDKQGDNIGYAVAVDNEQQTMARTWYEPAARTKMLGFPAVFIVDHSGKIVWIGPANKIESVIEDIAQGRFDPQTGLSLEKDYKSVFKRIALSRKNEDYKTVIRLVDSLITCNPLNKSLYLIKFKDLLEMDMHLALDYGRYLLSGVCHEDESILGKMSDAITSKNHLEEYRNFNELSDLVIYLTDRALVLSKSDLVSSRLMFFQAQAYANKRQFNLASEKQKVSIQYFDKEIPIDIEVAKQARKTMMDLLESYKKQTSPDNGL